MPKQPKVITTGYHRNGIGGEGFQVSIIDDPENGRMLFIDFAFDYGNAETDPESAEWDAEHYGFAAVLNLDKATEGNIHMHPTGSSPGGNAWRGDRLGDQYRPLVRAFKEEK